MGTLNQKLDFKYYLNQIKPEGFIVYEYNPLRVLRLSQDTDSEGRHPDNELFEKNTALSAGTIVDLDTPLLKFNLNHPVDILILKSYDGSDNLIINDNYNIPRLINSRFTVLPKNRYKVVDRIGNTDTNLYDENLFDLDTSLYKKINLIPKISLNQIGNSGNLKVGNYVIYIKYSDADDNETDFVAESGLITCFIGTDGNPFNILGGIGDENAHKSISLNISNVDNSYDFIKVYFTRVTSDLNENKITKAFKILSKYSILDTYSNILITGDEPMIEIPLSEILREFFLVDKVLTLTTCQNRLFFGNVYKPKIDYEDLKDISLRIIPSISVINEENLIGDVELDYTTNSQLNNQGGYYNTYNIYNYLGYWPDEIYRFGVVYILNDYTLSPVFNIRGTLELSEKINSKLNIPSKNPIPLINDRQQIQILEKNNSLLEELSSNSKGVSYIPLLDLKSIVGILMNIPKNVLKYLESRVKGLFFVRLKRIPTTLCLTITLPIDTTTKLPLISKDSDLWYLEGFLDEHNKLTLYYNQRLKNVNLPNIMNLFAGICPEYDLRSPYFNQLFTGNDFNLNVVTLNTFKAGSNNRSVQVDLKSYQTGNYNIDLVKIIGVEDNNSLVTIGEYNFKARAGEAEEAFRFEELPDSSKIRGSFGPYLGMLSKKLLIGTYDIKIPEYSSSLKDLYFNIRYNDNSPYYPISDRLSISEILNLFKAIPSVNSVIYYQNTFYRGDCYLCTFTHRLNRNFQDPDTPINDKIVDSDTWNLHYNPDIPEEFEKINRGDVNAIELGTWITFKVRSTYNLNLRSLDHSNPAEEGLTGRPRNFYPLYAIDPSGPNKIPESKIINSGYGVTTGEKTYFTLPDVPYIKNRLDNRIAYSDISINDAFRNGFRVFLLTNYRDYPRTYGGLTKLVELSGTLLAVWEHGIGIIPVNERTIAGESAGGNVFINTSNVLPENPNILSDKFGSQWKESVLKTPHYVYGVDTIGKKIWRTNGGNFEIISDFKIQEFLNNNITLLERELDPIIGIRNVKTHYNAFKKDVMFTFYDNSVGFEEVVWNICYNELQNKWVTFYSWVPSYSENIDNIYFSFNRNTSKWISKLGTSLKGSTSEDGIVMDNVVLDNWTPINIQEDIENDKGEIETITKTYLQTTLDIVGRARVNTDKTDIKENEERLIFSLNRDNYKNYKNFEIVSNISKDRKKGTENLNILRYKGPIKYDSNTGKYYPDDSNWKYPVLLLNISCIIEILTKPSDILLDLKDYMTGWKDYLTINGGLYSSVVAITTKRILNNSAKDFPNLTTDFWKHGQSGIIDIKDPIKPCFWYGEQHPFEFEVVVLDNPTTHKLFNNLEIISNKAKPESFHYEIIGECFDFAKEKPNMFVRLEFTKDFYQYNGSDILYNRKAFDVETKQNEKSTTLPLYYTRVDTINEVEDSYKGITSPGKDYNNLSGTEIVYYPNLNEFRLWEHSKAVDINDEGGRLRGNMNYLEDKWLVQINPIVIVQKNEKPWNKIPITVGNNPVPNDLPLISINSNTPTEDYIPEDLRKLGYKFEDIDSSDWGIYPVKIVLNPDKPEDFEVFYADAETRKEVKVKDKFMKVRIRYTGSELAIITAINTLYNISYA